MPSLNFMAQFADDVQSGRKHQTIRLRGKRKWKKGDTAYLFTGMRTRKCRRLGRGLVVEVNPVIRLSRGRWEADNGTRWVNDRYSAHGLMCLAASDGFDSVQEFEDFFERYEDGAKLQIIRWELAKKE